MELKLVEAYKMKSLEDYVVALVTGMIVIKNLESFHERAINLGILKEDHECRANTILEDCKRIHKLYWDQAVHILELLPEGFALEKAIEELNKNKILAHKKLTRKHRTKKE